MALRPFNYVYPPFTAWIASLFSGATFVGWVRVWFAVMLVTLGGAWFLLSQTVDGLSPARARDWLLLLSFPGLWYALVPFQNSTVSLLLVCSAAMLLTRGRPFLGGAVIACAFYKPHLALSVGCVMLVAGRYRFVVGLGAAAIGSLAAQLYACGLDLHLAWISSIALTMRGEQFQWIGLNQSFLGWSLSLPGVSRHVASGIGIAGSAAMTILAGVALRHLRRLDTLPPGYDLLLATALSTVTSPHTAFYDFLLVLGVWAICCRSLQGTKTNVSICFLGWLVSLLAFARQDFPLLMAPMVVVWISLAVVALSGRLEGLTIGVHSQIAPRLVNAALRRGSSNGLDSTKEPAG